MSFIIENEWTKTDFILPLCKWHLFELYRMKMIEQCLTLCDQWRKLLTIKQKWLNIVWNCMTKVRNWMTSISNMNRWRKWMPVEDKVTFARSAFLATKLKFTCYEFECKTCQNLSFWQLQVLHSNSQMVNFNFVPKKRNLHLSTLISCSGTQFCISSNQTH